MSVYLLDNPKKALSSYSMGKLVLWKTIQLYYTGFKQTVSYKQFVKNPVNTTKNPADAESRGMPVGKMREH